jgi:hypothetical protein
VIDARETHIEMHELIKSFKDHAEIPTTFDGQMPEYAFGADAHRILIGERYIVPDHDGVERPALVTAATVMEAEWVVYAGVTFDDGRSAICTMPLSNDELAAWRRHPDTFFGIVGQRSTHANSARLLRLFSRVVWAGEQRATARSNGERP